MNVAQTSFKNILQTFNSADEKDTFIKWVNNYLQQQQQNNNNKQINGCCHHDDHNNKSDEKQSCKADVLLSCVKTTLKEKLPLNGTFKSEAISFPSVGEDTHLNTDNCVHVDAFLYDESEVDQLVDDGRLSNSYCMDCKSTNIEDITFITHSASKRCLEYIFTQALPSLNDKVVMDVGSRLGVVLYAAHVYSKASEIIGVEMNAEFCDLQRDMLKKFKMTDRCKVLEGDIRSMPNIVKKADVIILNNVFEWFLSVDEQTNVWKFLHSKVKSGSVLVAAPPIHTSLELLDTGINVEDWISEINLDQMNDGHFIEDMHLKFYKVL